MNVEGRILTEVVAVMLIRIRVPDIISSDVRIILLVKKILDKSNNMIFGFAIYYQINIYVREKTMSL